MLFLFTAHATCDADALKLAAEGLSADAGPTEAGALIAEACPTPRSFVRALQAPTDPQRDVQAAIAHPGAWENACDAALDAIPDGFAMPSPGKLLDLWSGCDLQSLDVMDADEWMGSTGPPVTTILAAVRLKNESVPMEVRRPLVRALAGVPIVTREQAAVEDPLLAADPLAAFRDEADPRAVLLAPVQWPPNTPEDLVCTARLDILADGAPSRIRWKACPESVRTHVEAAIVGSWFEPARRNDRAVRGQVQLDFSPRR